MTSLVSPDAPETTHVHTQGQLSAARASWLLVRLRFARWRNRARHVFGGSAAPSNRSSGTSSKATPGRRGATATSAGGDIGILVGLFLLLALFSAQSFNLFENIATEHGPSGVKARATFLCSLLVISVFMLGHPRTDAIGGKFDEDLDWLLTLPAPAWVLHAGKLVESALTHPICWMLIFPFLTGLGLHSGLGFAAPLVALGFCLPLFAVNALFQWLTEIAVRTYLPGPLARVARGVLSGLGALVFAGYLVTPALARLNLGLPGHWLDFASPIGWLPFAEPALAVTSLSEDPRRALAICAGFALEIGAAIGLGAVGLRRVYQRGLIEGSRPLEGTRGSAPSRRRKPVFRGVVGKDLIWFQRHPARIVGLMFGAALANIAAVLWLKGAGADSGTPAAFLGGAVFGAGMWLLLLLTVLTEGERPALALLLTLPRSPSRTFAEKSIFGSVLACASTLPLVIYGSPSLASFWDALPALLYAMAGLFVYGFIGTALWLWRVNPTAPTSPLQHAVRSAQWLLLAGFFSAGFAFPSLRSALPLLVLAGAFAFTFWHDALARLAFGLDPTARAAPRFSATYAIVAIVLMRVLQMQALQALTQAGLERWPSLVLSYVGAGSVVTLATLSRLVLRGVPRLREVLGLGRGLGLRVTLREGLLWSLPAIGINVVFVWVSRHWSWLDQSFDAASKEHWSVALAGHSAWLYVGLSTLAAPLVEELLFRGMLYRALRSQWAVAVSLLLSAAVFTAVHPRAGALPLFCMAACASLAFERSKSLFGAVLVHATYNGFVAWAVLSS